MKSRLNYQLWSIVLLTVVACSILNHHAVAQEKPAVKKPAAKVSTSSDKGLRVFTCGHSFHVWVVPLLSELAMNAGIADHQIAGLSSIGGSTVLKHWNVPDENNKAKQALRAGTVDVLTLSPIWLPDEGIENFATLAVQANPNIRITVQEYWLPNDEYVPVYPLETKKKVDHNATTIPALRTAQDQYDHDVDEYVRALNKKLGKDALITVPVGLPRPAILTRNPAWDDQLNRLLQELAWNAVTKHPMSGVDLKSDSKGNIP